LFGQREGKYNKERVKTNLEDRGRKTGEQETESEEEKK
jgi:hypothetical protein